MGSPVHGTFETDEDTGVVTITANATHPAVRRYFGPPPDLSGQESMEARIVVAEIVAHLTVLAVLRRHLRQQPLPVEQMYPRRYQMLDDLLPLCHASQLTETELPSAEVVAGRKKWQAASAAWLSDRPADQSSKRPRTELIAGGSIR